MGVLAAPRLVPRLASSAAAGAGLFALLAAPLCARSAAAQVAPSTALASVSSDGAAGDADSREAALSADGRRVAFASASTNFGAGPGAGVEVYVHDLASGLTWLASADPAGGPGGAASARPALSADGRFVAFESNAAGLVAGDANGAFDVFVRDLQLGTTVRASVATGGAQAHGDSGGASLSADGRFVAFHSVAADLVPGDTNGASDVFVHDVWTGTTERVSVSAAGRQAHGASLAPALDASGARVAFESSAPDLVAGDTNGVHDVFVRDRRLSTTLRGSLGRDGAEPADDATQASLSADGRLVAFQSASAGLVAGDTNAASDVFVRDLEQGATRRVSVSSSGAEGGSDSARPRLSADGRFVAFHTFASDLVPGDSNGSADVLVHELATGATTRASLSTTGAEPNHHARLPALSGDGRFVAFDSHASNFGTPGFLRDVFVRDRGLAYHRYCEGTAELCPCGNAGRPGAGCDSSHHTGGGRLAVSGSWTLSADSARLTASGLPPTAVAAFLEGVEASTGVPFGDGLRCLTGATRVLGVRSAAGGVAEWGLAGDPPLSVGGTLSAQGGVRRYQAWYRNAEPFCTAAAHNGTSAVELVWVP